MKKLKILVIVLLLAILTTGCDKNKLICTKNTNLDGVKTDYKYEIKFDHNKPLSGKFNIKMIFDDESVKYIDLTYKDLKQRYNLNEENGIKIKKTQTENTINFRIDVDFEKVNEFDKLEINIKNNQNLNDIKMYLEDMNYKCK